MLIDLQADFFIKGEVEQQAKGDLQQKLVITRNEPVEPFYDSQFFHFGLVITEDRQFLQKVKHYEQQVRVIPFQHIHQLLDDLSVLHLPFDLEVFSQVQKQVEGHKQDLFLLPHHQSQLLLFLPHELGHLLVLSRTLRLLN